MAKKSDEKKSGESSSKKKNGNGGTAAASETPQPQGETEQHAGQPHLSVLAQFMKDLSFESPNAPQSLQGPGENPQLKVSVNVTVAGRGEDVYEVVLNLDVHARSDLGIIYNVELVYGGLFRLHNIPQERLQPVLFVDCPTILFPFLRRLLADITRDGGFPPLMLDPVDFNRLYLQNIARGQQEAQAKN